MKARFLIWMISVFVSCSAFGQVDKQVVDIQTRAGVTQRMVVLMPKEPKASVILFAGGHGGLKIFPNGSFGWGDGNFLVRTSQLFADQGLLVAVIDAPSDRQSSPFLSGFRQTPEHVQDIQATIAWLRAKSKVPVWLVGTSRGTQSVAYIGTKLHGPDGPDGLVLTSTILADKNSRAVPEMALEDIHVPVLVVHHEEDGCKLCSFAAIPGLMSKLGSLHKAALLTFKGGNDRGDPCEAMAHHGFNGLESDVVSQTAAWILAN
jgi:pimeloyl-ACP methyl ester carboxylesterase